MTDDLLSHVIKWIAILLIVSVASCTADDLTKYTVYAHAINQATETGRDPMEVGCAFGFAQTGESAVCAVNQSKR